MHVLAKNSAREAFRSSRWVMLTVLILAYVCSNVDRMAITLLIEPIKAHFGASDGQIGLLQGVAFTLVYSVVGLPAGRLIDRSRRVTIIAIAIVGWSVMTSFCGLAPTFLLLFIGRGGVAIGEAALMPGAYSLIADGFNVKRQGVVVSLYQAAGGLGAGLALAVGGGLLQRLGRDGAIEVPLIGSLAPWQIAFLGLGLPGLLVAALLASLAEPERKMYASGGGRLAWFE